MLCGFANKVEPRKPRLRACPVYTVRYADNLKSGLNEAKAKSGSRHYIWLSRLNIDPSCHTRVLNAVGLVLLLILTWA